MSYRLQFDESWPSLDDDALGIKNGILVPPGSLDEPEELTFDATHTVVTPGWINAHAHLELTGVPEIEYDGNFLNWIYEILDFKRDVPEHSLIEDYRKGLSDLVASGVTRVVDHCDRTDLVTEFLPEVAPSVHLYKELIAFSNEQIEALKTEAADYLETLRGRGLDGGLAPHAPYSAHPEVYRWAARQVFSGRFGLSSHLHEVRAELEFTEDGDGIFLDLLEDRTRSHVDSPYDGGRPLPYLTQRDVFVEPCFGVHLNYTTDEDRRWLEASRICPVFCPKSYSYFNHRTLPVETWVERGQKFALGTDSMASNDSLDMLEELRRLDTLTGDIAADVILAALTTNPAEVLKQPGRGVLTWGTAADLAVFDVPSGDLGGLVRGRAEPLATVIEGEPVWSRPENAKR